MFAPFLIMSPKRSFGRHIVVAPFLIKYPNKVWRLIGFAPLLIIIKSPNEIWRLIVFAPFLIIIIKSPNEVWSLIVFAPFLIIIIIIIIINVIPFLLLAVNLSDQILRD